MPRYFFDLQNGSETIPDEEGVEIEDREAVATQAGCEVDAMRAAGEMELIEQGWTLAIRDEQGTEIIRINV